MKDKEVCQNWIKILGDVLFTIYMYLVAQTKFNTIQQRNGESCIFQSFATNLRSLTTQKSWQVKGKQRSLTTTRHWFQIRSWQKRFNLMPFSPKINLESSTHRHRASFTIFANSIHFNLKAASNTGCADFQLGSGKTRQRVSLVT